MSLNLEKFIASLQKRRVRKKDKDSAAKNNLELTCEQIDMLINLEEYLSQKAHISEIDFSKISFEVIQLLEEYQHKLDVVFPDEYVAINQKLNGLQRVSSCPDYF
ncbi:MAG: hypothetical protein AB7G87_03790 [Clostridia bacterium]